MGRGAQSTRRSVPLVVIAFALWACGSTTAATDDAKDGGARDGGAKDGGTKDGGATDVGADTHDPDVGADAHPPDVVSSDGGGLLGVFHLPEEGGEEVVDALNLRIDPGGTALWTIEGCDYCSGDRARWADTDQTRVLRPASDGVPLYWFHEVTVRQALDRVEVTPSADGAGLDLAAFPVGGGSPFRQRWLPGRTCPDCSGGHGIGGTYPCDTPLPEGCAAD